MSWKKSTHYCLQCCHPYYRSLFDYGYYPKCVTNLQDTLTATNTFALEAALYRTTFTHKTLKKTPLGKTKAEQQQKLRVHGPRQQQRRQLRR